MTVVKDEIVLEQKSFFLRLFQAVKGELLTKLMRKVTFLRKALFFRKVKILVKGNPKVAKKSVFVKKELLFSV